MKRILLAILLVLAMAIPAIAADVTYFCVATAYDSSDNESIYSNETSFVQSEGAADPVLGWTPPTTNEDGSIYDDPGGFKLYCGVISGGPYAHMRDITDHSVTEAPFPGLNPARRPNPPGGLNKKN